MCVKCWQSRFTPKHVDDSCFLSVPLSTLFALETTSLNIISQRSQGWPVPGSKTTAAHWRQRPRCLPAASSRFFAQGRPLAADMTAATREVPFIPQRQFVRAKRHPRSSERCSPHFFLGKLGYVNIASSQLGGSLNHGRLRLTRSQRLGCGWVQPPRGLREEIPE